MIDKEYELQMEQIELILQEADRYGLRYEVQMSAEIMIVNNPNLDIVKAYQYALEDWDLIGGEPASECPESII